MFMNRKSTLDTTILFFIGALLFPILSFSQVEILNQGFDNLPADTWGYSITTNTGTAGPNNARYVTAPNALLLQGSDAIGTGAANNDPFVTFNNQSLAGYTNAKISIQFSSDGSPDDNDDLYLDVSYDNGATFTSIQLMDGKNSNLDNLGFTHAAVAGNTVGSTFVYSIPNVNTQVLIRVRMDELDNQSNTTDRFYIDNVKLIGTPIGYSIYVLGLNNYIPHNSAVSTTNGTDFGSVQIITDPKTRIFTIKNVGSNTINLLGSPAVTITGSSDFTITSYPTTPISSTNSTNFQVRFNPSSIGVKTATISIASNDADENPYILNLKGVGAQTFFDSDADGIFDNVDIDDDNDGIRDVTEELNCINSNGTKVNYKFLSETFGSGARTTIDTNYNAFTTYCYEDGTVGVNTIDCPNLSSTDLNDGEYTVGSTAQIASWANDYWYKGVDHTGNASGRMAIFNASYTPGVFYTATISGALPGIPITYSFWVINLDRSDAPGIATRLRPNVKVEFRDINDNLLNSISTGDIAPTTAGNLTGNWYRFTSNLTFSVSTFKVIFINNETGGGGNDLALDDIEISQTLCDSDNDGVADVFDLDTDNDGLPDIVEDGLGNLSNAKGRMDVAWVDANGNGLHDSAEALTVTLDSDLDGVPNYIDLDSDNDSVFDVDESGTTNVNAADGFVNGDGDITGDGVGDGPESETFRLKDTNGDGISEGFGDGILDLYDYANGLYGNLNQGTNTTPFLNYLLDSDSDGIPDYIDLKSDGTNFDISKTLYASLDGNNNGIIDGTIDADKDGILDNFDTNTSKFGSPRNLERKLFVEFDGRNDYAQDNTSIINGSANATMMGWVNLGAVIPTDAFLFGQEKFQVKFNAGKKLQLVANTTTLTYTTSLATSQWIHIAAVYDSANSLLKLYVNGVMVTSSPISGSLNADTSLFTIAKNPLLNNKYFKGSIDEVRVFDKALTDAQVQKMVYQEIKDNSGQIQGAIIPKDISSLPWNNLKRYYKMDNFKDNVIDDHTTTSVDVLSGAKIYNVKNIKAQQAPMPFVTQQTGTIATAINSVPNQIRGLDATDNSWAIIVVNHDVTSTSNHTNLGMIVNSSKNVVISNSSKLQNDWYLKLDGKIDLQGRSQLVQTLESDLEPTSSGKLERDQQGTSNVYNYNYWSSPVGAINATSNNNSYTVDGVMKDGTDPLNIKNINWTSASYNGAPTTPITLASYWLWKFQNVTDLYANWTALGPNGALLAGQGYTMKGSGSALGYQNYTFVGKPNNGTITMPISANNTNLSGNPYASAIDVTGFINDNAASTLGTIYFWEQFATNNTHILRDYQGGYAARNLTGGTTPVSPAGISGLGSSSRTPKQFIPVGQGFFVYGNATGGNITFKNSQRLFVKEDDANSNVMFKSADNNNNDPYPTESYAKIHLGYTSNNDLHRQLLLGFMNEKATSGLDYGYDGIVFDEELKNDMNFLLGTNKLVIQADGNFDTKNIYPLFVKSDVAGKVKFMIDGLENFDANQPIYIYDDDAKTYNDIRNQAFEVEIPIGENSTRFSLRFGQETLGTNNNVALNDLNIVHIQNGNVLIINNKKLALIVEKVQLYNVLGQQVSVWNVENQNQENIQLPIKNLSSGTYIANIKTTKGSISKKIIIK